MIITAAAGNIASGLPNFWKQ